jgi:hypothetical protein
MAQVALGEKVIWALRMKLPLAGQLRVILQKARA